jgi:hypothetical protein
MLTTTSSIIDKIAHHPLGLIPYNFLERPIELAIGVEHLLSWGLQAKVHQQQERP